MKRTPLKRKVGLKRGSKLRIAGKSTSSELKRDIQALLREIVMLRDGGCILRDVRNCGGELGIKGVVIQADHLVTRANAATYADHRLVVCVCRGCHFWKKYHKEQYDALVKSVLSEEKVGLWETCEQSRWRPTHTTAFDWKLQKIALEQERNKLKNAAVPT